MTADELSECHKRYSKQVVRIFKITLKDFQGVFKHIASSFFSLTEERFSEHQSSVAQNILLSLLDRDVMRSRSTAEILFDKRFSHALTLVHCVDLSTFF